MNRKTPIAAKEVGISYHRLINLIRFGAIMPPEKDSSGDYVWSDSDVEAARKVIAGRQKPETAKRQS